MLLRLVDDFLVRDNYYVWLAEIKHLWTIARCPTMVRGDKYAGHGQVAAECCVLKQFGPARGLEVARKDDTHPIVNHERYKAKIVGVGKERVRVTESREVDVRKRWRDRDGMNVAFVKPNGGGHCIGEWATSRFGVARVLLSDS